MTNGDKIRKMSDQELAEYIYSVFLAGKITASKNITHPFDDTEVYIDWLKKVSND